ncbi:MAG: hypothetical protein PHS96_02775 [Anaerolineales bacterium]|nr:hypothetical protein [Anaerolineales bacterium]
MLAPSLCAAQGGVVFPPACRGAFTYIPGDETISVPPFLEGYSFQPAAAWRHYHGFEIAGPELTASPPGVTAAELFTPGGVILSESETSPCLRPKAHPSSPP